MPVAGKFTPDPFGGPRVAPGVHHHAVTRSGEGVGDGGTDPTAGSGDKDLARHPPNLAVPLVTHEGELRSPLLVPG